MIRAVEPASPVRTWGLRLPLLAATLLFAVTAITGCSSSTGSESSPDFWSSGTPVAPDQVRLAGGPSISGTLTLLVQVVGPTSADDLSGFSFDLLLSDPAVADYVDGSATVGTALDPDGTSGVSIQVVHNLQRVSVTVSRRSGSGNGVSPGQATVLALRYRVQSSGTTAVQFAPDPAPAALDAQGVPISSISYDMVPSAIVGH